MSDPLRRPFRATGAELEFYQHAINRWLTLPPDEVLTEAARLFNFAVALVSGGHCKEPSPERSRDE